MSGRVAPATGSGTGDFEDRLREAQRLHQIGRLDEPATICTAILSEDPESADALHVLALIRMQQRRIEDAAGLITRALDVEPKNAAYLNTSGLIETRRNDRSAAEAAFRGALAVAPNFAQALLNLGKLVLDDGRGDEAEALLRRAIRKHPKFAPAYFALADMSRGRGDAGRAAYWDGFGWHAQNKFEQAVVHFRQACTLQPGNGENLKALGHALIRSDRPQEAIGVLKQALAVDESSVPARRDLAMAYVAAARFDDAIECYDQVIGTAPNNVKAHVDKAQCLLRLGRFAVGWQEFEWRVKDDLISQERVRGPFERPAWDGRRLSGERLLVHTEQGMGDILQLIRYLPMVKERGGRIVFECERELLPLLEGAAGWDEIVAKTFSPDLPYPEHDFHISLLSLPFIFGTTEETIPNAVPYLHPEESRRAAWEKRLSSGPLRVGLAWAGNPRNPNDRIRSIRLAQFAPLGNIPGVAFYGLQVGEAAAQEPPRELELVSFGDDLRPFEETAAAMANLDLIITVDTATAHLAGALALPTWTLLSHVPDWRWLLDRPDSPWYPSMRLYRQSAARDWRPVIDRVAADLTALVARRST
ncbi:MAG: tetratricopeptide repeat protein [Alphaproteobacteria bacterium]|nr:tetratricopeptide repeat protein [Alphaproteobacteria bacterium]